jgi:glutamyl-tRNA reductase
MRALIIGVGEASRLAGLALRDRGVNSLTVANRTPENATALADELDAAVTDLGDLKALIVETDVVITATAAPDFILSAELIQDAMLIRDGRPLMIIDIAVPRDVEPAASELPGVHIFVLDDLEAIAEANRLEREAEVAKVELIVAEELERFRSWWGVRAVTPTIAAIRHRAEEVRASEVAKAIEQMASPEDAARLEKMTKALVKKLLHQPTASLRSRNDEAFTRSARDLFGLDA